jgi:hypothetical protein
VVEERLGSLGCVSALEDVKCGEVGAKTALFLSMFISVALVLSLIGSCAEDFFDVGGEWVMPEQLVPLLWVRSRTAMVHLATTHPSSLRRGGGRISGHGTLVGGVVGSSKQRGSLLGGRGQVRCEVVRHCVID